MTNQRKFNDFLKTISKVKNTDSILKQNLQTYLPANIKRVFENLEEKLSTFITREVHFLERFWRLLDKRIQKKVLHTNNKRE